MKTAAGVFEYCRILTQEKEEPNQGQPNPCWTQAGGDAFFGPAHVFPLTVTHHDFQSLLCQDVLLVPDLQGHRVVTIVKRLLAD